MTTLETKISRTVVQSLRYFQSISIHSDRWHPVTPIINRAIHPFIPNGRLREKRLNNHTIGFPRPVPDRPCVRYFEGRRLETRENMFVPPPDPTFMHALNPEKQRRSDINRPPFSTHINDVVFRAALFQILWYCFSSNALDWGYRRFEGGGGRFGASLTVTALK